MNAEKAIYREKIRLEREKTKMTEELNTENQQQELTVADICEQSSEETLLSSEDTPPNEHIEISLANAEETQDTSPDETENLAARLNEETQPLEPDSSNQSSINELLRTKPLATDTKPATIEGLQDNQIENRAAGNNNLEPAPSNQLFNSEFKPTTFEYLEENQIENNVAGNKNEFKPPTIEGLEENQIENKAAGNKNASVTGDAGIIGSLEDTLNESSQQDESLQSGKETKKITRRERHNDIEPSSETLNNRSNQTSENESNNSDAIESDLDYEKKI